MELKIAREDGGEHITWRRAGPNLLVAQTCSQCPRYEELTAEALRKHPCSQDRP